MTKKILASLLAVLLTCGAFVFMAAAAEEPEKPAYTPVEYQLADLVAALKSGKDVYLQPTDVIVLPGASTAEPEKPETPAAEDPQTPAGEVPQTPAAEDPQTPAEAESEELVLIVEYLPGDGGYSEKNDDVKDKENRTYYVDYDGSGYAIRALGEEPDYTFTKGERKSNVAIDFVHEKEYKFVQWKVVKIYDGKEFNRIVLEADWDEPPLTGWAGFKTLMRGYIKTIIDYIIDYLGEWFRQLGDFMTGSSSTN